MLTNHALRQWYNAHGDDQQFRIITSSPRQVTNDTSSPEVTWRNVNRASRNLAEEMAEQARKEGIYVFTLGLGSQLLLPAYSPELNPDELADAGIELAVTTQAPESTGLRLAKVTTRHLRGVQKRPERIRRCFEHTPVRYAASCKLMKARSIVPTL